MQECRLQAHYPFDMPKRYERVNWVLAVWILKCKKSTTLSATIISMGGDDEDLSDFLKCYGFTEEELNCVLYDLNSFRTIPGTTIERYMNRIIDTIDEEDRLAFLKGVLIGIAIRRAADVLAERDLIEEEMRLTHEIEKFRFG